MFAFSAVAILAIMAYNAQATRVILINRCPHPIFVRSSDPEIQPGRLVNNTIGQDIYEVDFGKKPWERYFFWANKPDNCKCLTGKSIYG